MQDDATGGGWSVPGSLVEQPQADGHPGAPSPPGAPAPGTGSGWTGSGPGGSPAAGPGFGTAGPLADLDGIDPAPVPKLALQPMTVADILDGAFTIIKARPARIFAVSALMVIPLHLFIAWFNRNNFGNESLWDTFSSEDPAVFADTTGSSAFDYSDLLKLIAVMLLPTLAWTLVAAAVAHMVAAWTAGRDVAAGELLGVVGRRFVPLLAAWAVIHVMEGGSMLVCNLGFPFVMALFLVTGPVIGAEGLGPFAAMRRSLNLTTRRYWPTLGIGLLIGLVAVLLGNALGGALQLAAVFAGFEVQWILLAIGSIVGAVVTTPFVASAVVLLYLDLRVRTEGLDIELAAIDLAHNAA